MQERKNTCCFSGHRSAKLPWGRNENDPRCRELVAAIDERLFGIYHAGYRHFICGMALGCDTLFAEAVLRLKEEMGDVSLEAAVPCAGQAEGWSEANRSRYEALLSRCDRVTVLQQSYTPDCMMRRNRYMVDKSSLLLACFNGSRGGTLNTINYAKSHGVPCLFVEMP